MAMRVATFSGTSDLVQAAMRVQAEQADATLQQASGKVATDYGGYGAGAGRIIALETYIDRTTIYEKAATAARSQVEAAASAVGSMADLLNQFTSALTSIDASLSDGSTLQETAASILDQMTALMNTKYQGRYLFAGSATDLAPVVQDAIAPQSTPTSADTSYYAGTDETASVRVSAEEVIRYGVTADDAGFETTLRALSLIAGADLSGGGYDDATLTEARSLVETAVSGLSTAQARLGLSSAALESAITARQDDRTYAETELSGKTDIDVAAVAARLSSYQTQLEAAYAAIGKIQSLRLSDFLK